MSTTQQRTVEQINLTGWEPIDDAIERCLTILDPTTVNDWDNCPAQCSADLALIARYFVRSQLIADLRRDAEKWRALQKSLGDVLS